MALLLQRAVRSSMVGRCVKLCPPSTPTLPTLCGAHALPLAAAPVAAFSSAKKQKQPLHEVYVAGTKDSGAEHHEHAAVPSHLHGREPADEFAFPEFKGQTKLFINGKFVDSHNGKTFIDENPGNGELLARVAEADVVDVSLAAKAAHKAFTKGPWGTTMTARERGAMLYKLADLVEQHKDELAELESLDNGKSINLSKNVDAPACATMLRYWAGWADKITSKVIPMSPSLFCHTRHEPVGVVGAIIPWNLPLIGVAAKLGPALTAGNTVVLKSAENTPLSALRVAELVAEAGFPDGVVNIISGFGHKAGAAMVAHPLIDKISFTGSLAVGQNIQMEAAASMKRVTLELGGKNPSIVFADANIENALEHVHNGVFWNKGEACAAGTRIFVQEKIYDEFLEKATQKAMAQVVGNPFDPKTDQGALVSNEQFLKVQRYIGNAQKHGERLVAGGHRVGTKGYYLEPTVFADVSDKAEIFTEEVFGPVMTISKFKDKEEVIERANNTKYGLAAGVFTQDMETGHDVCNRIRAGMVFWNCYHAVDVAAPFGGMKMSGIGREGGEYGLLPYMEVKNVVTNVKVSS